MIERVENLYETKDIYLIYYEKGEEVMATGLINKIEKKNKTCTLFHTCDTDFDSSGSPVILYNHKVIGINRKNIQKGQLNRATLLQFPIKEYLTKLKQKELFSAKENDNNKDKDNKSKDNISKDKYEKEINNKKNIVDQNDKNRITMIYLTHIEREKGEEEEEFEDLLEGHGIKILGNEFIKNNKQNCKMIINEREYEICRNIECNKYGINENDDLLTITLTGINNCINIRDMFCKCRSLQSLPDILKLDTKNVTDISNMFRGCRSLQSLPDISKWDTKNITDMNYMFYGCRSLKSLPDVSNWDTKNVTNMENIFCGC